MNLLDSLRKVAEQLPPSHVPSLNELASLVGASIAHAEHGDSILKAAEQGAEALAKALTPEAAAVGDVLAPEAAPLIDTGEALAEAELSKLDPAPAANQAQPARADVTPAAEPAPAAPEAPAEPTEAEALQAATKTIEELQTALANAQRGEITVTPAEGEQGQS